MRPMIKAKCFKPQTIFQLLSILAILGLLVSSIVLVNGNSVNDSLQGWVNLAWLVLPVLILIVEPIFIRKRGLQRVRNIEFYILAGLLFVFVINWARLQLQV